MRRAIVLSFWLVMGIVIGLLLGLVVNIHVLTNGVPMNTPIESGVR